MGSSRTDYNSSIFFFVSLSSLRYWLELQRSFCAKANITSNNILLTLKFKLLIYLYFFLLLSFLLDVLSTCAFHKQYDLNKVQISHLNVFVYYLKARALTSDNDQIHDTEDESVSLSPHSFDYSFCYKLSGR